SPDSFKISFIECQSSIEICIGAGVFAAVVKKLGRVQTHPGEVRRSRGRYHFRDCHKLNYDGRAYAIWGSDRSEKDRVIDCTMRVKCMRGMTRSPPAPRKLSRF